MLVHRRVTPTWVERGTVRVKCLAQEHNTMSPARARTWTARSGVERTNHEATKIQAVRYCLVDVTCKGVFIWSELIILNSLGWIKFCSGLGSTQYGVVNTLK